MANFTGDNGNNSFTGGAGDDKFLLDQGGEDTAVGAGGDDTFLLGGAFDSGDQLNGGSGDDILVLDGDYSTGLIFGVGTLVNIERVELAAGHSYAMSGFSDVTGLSVINGANLGSADRMIINAIDAPSALLVQAGAGDDRIVGTAADDEIYGGAGANTLIGGDGDDSLFLSGADLAKGGKGRDGFIVSTDDINQDHIDGGGGRDAIGLGGGGSLALAANAIVNIEQITLFDNIDLTLADDNIAAGGAMTIVVHGDIHTSVSLDASAETDGRIIATSGGGDSILIGGALGDSLTGSAGDDLLQGDGGDDKLIGEEGHNYLSGGEGGDRLIGIPGGHDKTSTSTLDGGLGRDTLVAGGQHDTFVFHSIEDSTASAPDEIRRLHLNATIDLSAIDADTIQDGDQAFHLVTNFTGHAGELMLSFDSAHGVTDLMADVDGDGVTDFLVELKGDQVNFEHFAL